MDWRFFSLTIVDVDDDDDNIRRRIMLVDYLKDNILTGESYYCAQSNMYVCHWHT
jgi:hypothetical protein